MSGGANNVKQDPVLVFWQIEANEQIDFTGLTGADVDGKYFLINTAKDAIENYAWLNAGGADPAPAGKTEIDLVVLAGDNGTALASKSAAIFDALPGYSATSSGAVLDIKRTAVGSVTDTVDVDTGAVVSVCRRGKDFDLGLLDGDVEMNMSPSLFTVTSHSTGVTPRAALFQGFDTLEVTTTLQETTTANLKEIYSIYGGAYTPGGGTAVYGAGLSKQGQNMLVDAGRLVLKPVNSVDDTTNTNLMLAIPIPDALTFSGENPKLLSVTWQGFVDTDKDSRISGLLFGDAGQAGL